MSSVNAGRFEMLVLNVMVPASSFETTTEVMSGALASSPVESLKVWEFALARDELPNAPTGNATHTPTSAAKVNHRAAFK
jgi:hypothetical protein